MTAWRKESPWGSGPWHGGGGGHWSLQALSQAQVLTSTLPPSPLPAPWGWPACGQAPLHQLGPATWSPSPCCTGAPAHSLHLPKAVKQQRVPVMGNTHIWILLQQDGLRERERAGSGGKTERTEQEWVHLSRISNSTQRRGHGQVQPREHLPGTSASCRMLKMGDGGGEREVCWV